MFDSDSAFKEPMNPMDGPIDSCRPAPSRAVLGGLSVLLVVAFAFQASAGSLESKAAARQSRSDSAVRLVAETNTRKAVRATREQQQRPAAVTEGARPAPLRCATILTTVPTRTAPAPARPLVLLTDLPPPTSPVG